MSNKLQNIKAVKQMLNGNFRTQTNKTFGYSDTANTAEQNKKREVGEIWEVTDAHGNVTVWEQKDGYRVKTNKVQQEAKRTIELALNSFPKCPKETCTCTQPTRIDLKFKSRSGMCEDCTITEETKLKYSGKFNKYAIEKMRSNVEAFFKNIDNEVAQVRQDLKKVDFVDVDGRIEKWELTTEEMVNEIDSNYRTFKEKTLERLSG